MPLYLRILLWAAANALLVAFAFLALALLQFGDRLGPFFGGLVGEKLAPVSALLHADLSRTPPEQWGAALADLSAQYGVALALADHEGRRIAGEPSVFPTAVAEKIRGPHLREPERESQPNPRQPNRRFGPPRFFLRTANPTTYWVGNRLPPSRGRPRPEPRPAFLIASSPSITGGGFFFDPRPWALAAIGALGLSALWWFPFVGHLTRRIGAMSRATAQIAEGQFDTRIHDRSRDEVGRLAADINRMAGRLDGFVQGQKRFLGSVAHELCSPIARLQLALELLERHLGPEGKSALDRVRDETAEIRDLVNELLAFSKSSLQQAAPERTRVDLATIAREIAARDGTPSTVVIAHQPAFALASEKLVRRALSNIVRNAVTHAPGSPITITVTSGPGAATVSVEDRGPGVHSEDLPKLFDPFFRPDNSRSRDTGGAGLGLAIVKSCAEACGGTASASLAHPTGLAVTLRFQPAA